MHFEAIPSNRSFLLAVRTRPYQGWKLGFASPWERHCATIQNKTANPARVSFAV